MRSYDAPRNPTRFVDWNKRPTLAACVGLCGQPRFWRTDQCLGGQRSRLNEQSPQFREQSGRLSEGILLLMIQVGRDRRVGNI